MSIVSMGFEGVFENIHGCTVGYYNTVDNYIEGLYLKPNETYINRVISSHGWESTATFTFIKSDIVTYFEYPGNDPIDDIPLSPEQKAEKIAHYESLPNADEYEGLIALLKGESDGSPEEPPYIFQDNPIVWSRVLDEVGCVILPYDECPYVNYTDTCPHGNHVDNPLLISPEELKITHSFPNTRGHYTTVMKATQIQPPEDLEDVVTKYLKTFNENLIWYSKQGKIDEWQELKDSGYFD